MYLLIKWESSDEIEVLRALSGDELLDPRVHAEEWAKVRGCELSPDTGHVFEGDIYVATLPDPTKPWHVWASQSFFLTQEG